MQSQNIEAIYRLSPVQQGMLFHSQLDAASGVYFAQFCFTLQGNLDTAAFQRAWQHIVDRHPVLRTLFLTEKRADPLQIVRREATLPWVELDWRAQSAPEQAVQLAEFLAADRQRGFDLSQPPLMRLTLLQLADDAHRVVWSAHHLILDGWSLPLLVQEVMASYTAFYQGHEPQLTRVYPYQHYSKWLEAQDLAPAESYWRSMLDGFTAPTSLHVDRLPAVAGDADDAYTEYAIHLTPTLSTAIKAFAQSHQLTLNTVLQGAWALLLSRYSGEEDIVFGTVVSGRPANLPHVAEMVGPFINTLPIRVAVPDNAQLLPWLQRLQVQLVALREYEHSPLVEVQQWSDVPAGHALFESVFALENYPADALNALTDDLHISDINSIEQNSYPLSLMVVPGDKLWLRILYDCSRFDEATIARLLGHYQTLLEGIIAESARQLADLPLLPPAEAHHLLTTQHDTTQHDTTRAFAQEQPIHARFEAQVAQQPRIRCLKVRGATAYVQ